MTRRTYWVVLGLLLMIIPFTIVISFMKRSAESPSFASGSESEAVNFDSPESFSDPLVRTQAMICSGRGMNLISGCDDPATEGFHAFLTTGTENEDGSLDVDQTITNTEVQCMRFSTLEEAEEYLDSSTMAESLYIDSVGDRVSFHGTIYMGSVPMSITGYITEDGLYYRETVMSYVPSHDVIE